MSAEILRRAAALMRERAKAARMADGAASWAAIPGLDPADNGWIVAHEPTDADYDTTVARVIYDYEGYVSRHIASWHPTVALAVADWIEGHASDLASSGGSLSSCDSPGDVQQALAVARAYLGEQS